MHVLRLQKEGRGYSNHTKYAILEDGTVFRKILKDVFGNLLFEVELNGVPAFGIRPVTSLENL